MTSKRNRRPLEAILASQPRTPWELARVERAHRRSMDIAVAARALKHRQRRGEVSE